MLEERGASSHRHGAIDENFVGSFVDARNEIGARKNLIVCNKGGTRGHFHKTFLYINHQSSSGLPIMWLALKVRQRFKSNFLLKCQEIEQTFESSEYGKDLKVIFFSSVKG